MLRSISVGLALISAALPLAAALDAKWTPNGEAPAPYSTNARQQMGMDPSAFAGQAKGPPAVPPGGSVAMPFNAGALLVVYLSNNWKIVEAIQQIILKLLQPILSALSVRKEQQQKEAAATAAAAARKARLARLKSQAGAGSRKAVAASTADEGEDED